MTDDHNRMGFEGNPEKNETEGPGGENMMMMMCSKSNTGASVVWQRKGAEKIRSGRQKIVKIGDVRLNRFHSY